MRAGVLVTSILGLMCAGASAAPFNVRAEYAEGQVFVIWQNTGPPVLQTDTVEIYISSTPQVDTSLMTLAGRLFCPEYTGARLESMQAGATLRVPTPGGGTYQLAADEGAFAFTPHAAGTLFFAVVDSGSTTVAPANSDTVTFSYDPVNDPVRAHWQFSGTTFAAIPSTSGWCGPTAATITPTADPTSRSWPTWRATACRTCS